MGTSQCEGSENEADGPKMRQGLYFHVDIKEHVYHLLKIIIYPSVLGTTLTLSNDESTSF